MTDKQKLDKITDLLAGTIGLTETDTTNIITAYELASGETMAQFVERYCTVSSKQVLK